MENSNLKSKTNVCKTMAVSAASIITEQERGKKQIFLT